jgi:GT2 family glycosyltransferase
MHISVVICAYSDQRWADLVGAVESLRRQTFQPREIVVVIDHNPALLERTRAELPGVVAMANTQARGLSGARNSGVVAACGDVIAFLDDDAIAAPNWLERLSAGYADPQVLGVGGAIEPIWLAGRPAWFPEEFDWVVGCTYRGMPEARRAVQRLIGCNMSFRREVFAAIGGFRNGIGRVGKYPIAGEETELSIRVHRRWPQHALIYDPQVIVEHRVPASRANWGYFRTRCYCEGLSKALITHLVGASDSLQSERSYASRTLPAGMLREIATAISRGQPARLLRAGAIAIGLAVTVAGYIAGVVGNRSRIRQVSVEPRLAGEEHAT